MAPAENANNDSQGKQEEFFAILGKALENASKRQEEEASKMFWGQRPSSPDYGYSEKNPICSPSLSGTEAYLSRLRTKDGQKFTWKGYTSLRADCNGVEDVGIDKYDLYLKGNFFSSVYFAPYSGDSPFPPAGLFFADSMRDFATARKVFESNPTSVEVCFQLDDAEQEALQENKKNNASSLNNSSQEFKKKQTSPNDHKRCKKCGKMIPDDSVFCQFCGEEFAEIDQSTLQKGIQATKDEKKQAGADNDKKGKSPKRGALAWIIVLAILLLASNAFQGIYWSQQVFIKESENSQLSAEVSKLNNDLSVAKTAKTNAENSLKEAKSATEIVSDISTFLFLHKNDYQKYSYYYPGTNVIAVRVGESVELPITYTKQGTINLSVMNHHCKADWMDGWNGNTTYVKITGKSTGTTKLTFKVVNGTESFQVLVVVI